MARAYCVASAKGQAVTVKILGKWGIAIKPITSDAATMAAFGSVLRKSRKKIERG